MGGRDLGSGVDHAMEIDDLAGVGLAHAHVMDFTDEADPGSNLLERVADCLDALRRGVAPGHIGWLHGLDVGLDLDGWSELIADRRFEAARDLMGGAEAERAIDFEVERDGKARPDR